MVQAQAIPAQARATSAGAGPSVREALKQVDQLLASGTPEDEATAIALMAALRKEGVVRAFGAGQQVPKRIYSLEELRLNRVETEKLLAPRDDTLDGLRTRLQAALAAGVLAGAVGGAIDFQQLVALLFGGVFLLTLDQVGAGGGVEALVVDSLGRVLSSSYSERVAMHEAGHFLVAYLLGLLPRDYTLSSWSAFTRYRALNVQAGCQFCDREFSAEVASGKLRSSSLGVYACVALAGVATEYLRYGRAEGGLSDVQQLDGLLRALQFTQAKADGEVRWAVLNTIMLLRRHAALHDELAAAMRRGASVAECCALIEERVQPEDLAAAGQVQEV